MQATAYRCAFYRPLTPGGIRAGYVVVTQDTRGRYASQGEFKEFSGKNTGDAEDGYGILEWVANRPWCNGKETVLPRMRA